MFECSHARTRRCPTVQACLFIAKSTFRRFGRDTYVSHHELFVLSLKPLPLLKREVMGYRRIYSQLRELKARSLCAWLPPPKSDLMRVLGGFDCRRSPGIF